MTARFHHDRRGFMPLSRRQFGRGALGGAALAAAGGLARPAAAATDVYWIGWQGYDECFHATDYLTGSDITFNTTYINSNEEVITKLQAGGLGQYDIATMYFGYVQIMAAAGLIDPIDESKIEVLVEGTLIPEFLDKEAIRYEGQLYGVPWTWGTLPCMYDPAATEPPQRWKDLWNEEYKGKIVMIHDPLGNLYVWIPAITGNYNPELTTHAQLTETIDAMIDLKRNHARAMAQSYGEAADMFARNEVTVSALGWEAMVGFAAEKGKVIDYTIPEEGTFMFMDCLIVPKGAPNLDITYDLTNLCLSKEAQVATLAGTLGQAVVNLEAVPEVPEANREMYGYDDMAEIAKKAKLYPMPPTESDGTHATMDDWFEEYERLLKS
jgi:spermidine/putrescine-binding protein